MDDAQRSRTLVGCRDGVNGARIADGVGGDWSGLPPCWSVIRDNVDGLAFRRNDGLMVIASQGTELDGRLWFHVSLSRKRRMPSYRDMKAVKELFLGNDSEAYQVFPAADQHVNFHEYCLHLFALATGEKVLPDFTRGRAMI